MAFKQLSEETLRLIRKLDDEKMESHRSYSTNHVKCHYDNFMWTFEKNYPTLFHSLPVYKECAKLVKMAYQATPEEEMVIQWNLLLATIIDQVIQQDDGSEE